MSINQPSPSTEVECNPKMSISFFWLMGVRRSSSPLTSLANHQKINIIQKSAFHFLAGESGGWGSNPSTSHADHQKLNIIQK